MENKDRLTKIGVILVLLFSVSVNLYTLFKPSNLTTPQINRLTVQVDSLMSFQNRSLAQFTKLLGIVKSQNTWILKLKQENDLLKKQDSILLKKADQWQTAYKKLK